MNEDLLSKVFTHSEQILFQVRGEVILMVSLEVDEIFFQLNGLSAKLWTGIDGKRTLGEILSKVIADEKMPASYHDQFRKDTLALFDKLLTQKLVNERL